MTADQVATDKPIFDVEASVLVNAPAEKVYAVASDITRMGEWSPENTGGEWTTGQPGDQWPPRKPGGRRSGRDCRRHSKESRTASSRTESA